MYEMGDGNKVAPYPIGKWNKNDRRIEFNKSKKDEEDEGSDSDEEEEEEYEA